MQSKDINLDVTPMTLYPCAVHCRTEEEAFALIDALKEQFPEFVHGWYRDEPFWYTYEEDTCYTLFFTNDNGSHASSMTYCNIDHFRSEGYPVIELDDLIVEQVDIEESDIPLELFLVAGQ